MTDGVCAKLIYSRDNKLIEDDVYVVLFYYAKNFFQIFKCKDSDKCLDIEIEQHIKKMTRLNGIKIIRNGINCGN